MALNNGKRVHLISNAFNDPNNIMKTSIEEIFSFLINTGLNSPLLIVIDELQTLGKLDSLIPLIRKARIRDIYFTLSAPVLSMEDYFLEYFGELGVNTLVDNFNIVEAVKSTKSKPVSFRIDGELKRKIDLIAKAKCLNKTAWIESKIQEFIEQENKQSAGKCIR